MKVKIEEQDDKTIKVYIIYNNGNIYTFSNKYERFEIDIPNGLAKAIIKQFNMYDNDNKD